MGRPLAPDVRARLGAEVEASGANAVARRLGIARTTLERALLGGGVYAGTALLIRRACGLDPQSTNYRPTPDAA
jgi:hypothetical protein